MYTKIMDITPAIAAEMLEKNTNNYRRITSYKVEEYARKMRLGYWQENGEPIQFGKDGQLLNGQHRLAAIIKSGTTQRMLVVFDVDADVFDSGKNRSLREYAGISSAIGGVITIMITKLVDAQRNIISNEERADYYRKHYDQLDKSFLIACRGATTPIMRKAPCIAAVYCAIRLGILPDNDLEAFCRIVNSGLPTEGYASDSPLVLRKTIERLHGTGINGRAKCFDVTWQAIIAFKRGLKTRILFKPKGEALKVLDKIEEMDKEEAA